MWKLKFALVVFSLALLTGCTAVVVAPDVKNEENTKDVVSENMTEEKEIRRLGMYNNDGSATVIDPITSIGSKLLPDGHQLLSPHGYLDNPEYFVTEKDKQIYVVSVKTLDATMIDSIPALADDEIAGVTPSISDRNRFFVVVKKVEPEEGLYGIKVLSSRSYFVDGAEKQAKVAKGIESLDLDSFSTCYEYDSKFMRFFLWQCGEGLGSSTPLDIYSLADNKRTTVISKGTEGTEFELQVMRDNQRFIVMESIVTTEEGTNNKNIVLNVIEPTEKPTITKFTSAEGFEWINAYSVVYKPEYQAFVAGGSNEVSTMWFDEKNVINRQKKTEPTGIAASYPVTDGAFYYLHGDNELWKFDIRTGEVVQRANASGLLFTVLE